MQVRLIGAGDTASALTRGRGGSALATGRAPLGRTGCVVAVPVAPLDVTGASPGVHQP